MFDRRLSGSFGASRFDEPVGPRFARFAVDEDAPAGGEPGGETPEESPEPFEAVKARLIAESRRYRKRAQDAEAKLHELEATALSAEQAEEYRRLKDETEAYERTVAELTARHERDLGARRREVSALTDRLRRIVGADRLKSALASRGVTRVDQAAYLLDRHVRVEVSDGEPVVRVVDAAGEPIPDPSGAADATVSVERFVDAWLAAEGAHFLPPSGDVGSGAHRGGLSERTTVAEMEADPAKRFAFIREHGTDEYLRRLGQWKRTRAGRTHTNH